MFDNYNSSSNIFLTVIKNYEMDQLRNIPIEKEVLNQQIKNTKNVDSFNPIEYIEKLPTYKKICVLQNLLKQMISIKERFEENKNIMLERLKKNCINFYKNQIAMKAIYDYCKSNNPEKYYNYVLVEKNEERLGKENYDIINKVVFLIRNNNDLLINLIENCPSNSFDQFSDFLVNFFFNNTIDTSFNEEELIIIIYLIIEKNILNEINESEEEKKENNIYSNKSFIYYLFKNLTRKPDVRSFTFSILSKYIIQFEEYNDSISIETKVLKNRNRSKSINQKLIEMKRERNNSFSFNKENNLDVNELSKTFTYSNFNNNTGKYIEEILEDSSDSSDYNMETNIENTEIDPFFKENNITLDFLQNKFFEYEQDGKDDNVTIAMKTFIFNNINLLSRDNNEMFSNNVKVAILKKYETVNKDNGKLIEKIKTNYNIITKCIDEILDTLKENIVSSPYIIKSINSILYVLISQKYSKERLENVAYQTLIFLSNFLIGTIIIPLIINPYFNGIVTKGVVSKISKDNLEIISKILKQIISGNLFSNATEPEYTMFNKYIINTLPKIFEIIDKMNSQKNFKLSRAIRNLINSFDNERRNLNYNIFEENQENIQQQNVCFSWLDLIILIDTIKASKNLDKLEIYQKNIELFNKFLDMKAYFYDEYNGNNIDLQTDFFLFSQVIYSPYLSKQIHNLLEDNYFNILTNNEEENIYMFKKFFIEILSFINKLNDNNFVFLKYNIHKSFLYHDRNADWIDDRIDKNNKYLEIFSEEETSNTELQKKEEDEIDFKKIIFPNIIETIKNELAHNIDSITSRQIAFYTSYLQSHIDDLDNKYKEDNYSLLFMEIIKILESTIKEINTVIINQFYLKVKDGSKLNMIIKNNFLQTKKMEKCICIKYLFDKLILPCKLTIDKDEQDKITKITYEKISQNNSGNVNTNITTIQSFIDNFPDFRTILNNEVEDIIDFEENIEVDSILKSYFQDLKNLLKSESIMERYSKEEFDSIQIELENYILYQLYSKLFPEKQTKKDLKFYKKCCRLDFIKPEALIKDKKMINEKLWEASIILINELDNKFTPVDKVDKFGKAFGILQNSLTFSSGKNDLGIDDTIAILIYVMIKAKPKNIFSNSKYCLLYLNSELSKRVYGILLSQIEMIKNIIYNMKYTDLIGVTEEEFGKDDEE